VIDDPGPHDQLESITEKTEYFRRYLDLFTSVVCVVEDAFSFTNFVLRDCELNSVDDFTFDAVVCVVWK
jgi:hypothetical protein